MSPTNQMEQDDDFKSALSILKELEQQRTDTNQADKEQSEMIKLIETNIDECIQALLARKEALIREVKEAFKEKRKDAEAHQTEIKVSIETCQKLLEFGSALYNSKPDVAKQKWKFVSTFKITPSATSIEVKLPSLFDTIQKHGSVVRPTAAITTAAPALAHSNLFGDFVSQAAQQALLSWLPNKRFNLIYKASRDGFSAESFHKCCDNKGPTLTIIRSNPNNYLFGGYAALPWDSTTKNKTHPDCFIFTLTNPHSIPPTKYTGDPSKRSIYCKAGYGPCFGSGSDIYVPSNSNNNALGGTYFPNTYIDTTGKGQATFNGNPNYNASEIEVYSVN